MYERSLALSNVVSFAFMCDQSVSMRVFVSLDFRARDRGPVWVKWQTLSAAVLTTDGSHSNDSGFNQCWKQLVPTENKDKADLRMSSAPAAKSLGESFTQTQHCSVPRAVQCVLLVLHVSSLLFSSIVVQVCAEQSGHRNQRACTGNSVLTLK